MCLDHKEYFDPSQAYILVHFVYFCYLSLMFFCRIKKLMVKGKDVPESVENNEAIMNIHNGKVGRQVCIKVLI